MSRILSTLSIFKIVFINLKKYICYFKDRKMDKKTEEFYIRLKDELTNTSIWPSEYLYKFIVPSDKEKIETVEAEFNNMGAVIKSQKSKTGKYTSISISVQMKNPDHVIEKYKKMSSIEGIISL